MDWRGEDIDPKRVTYLCVEYDFDFDNRTISMDMGGGPNKLLIRIICSSSFLPRNKG